MRAPLCVDGSTVDRHRLTGHDVNPAIGRGNPPLAFDDDEELTETRLVEANRATWPEMDGVSVGLSGSPTQVNS